MKVYLLHLGEYSDRFCMGVYSTLEKAMANAPNQLGKPEAKLKWRTYDDHGREGFWETWTGQGADIEEFEVQ